MGFGLLEARRHHLNYKTNQGLMHTGEKNTWRLNIEYLRMLLLRFFLNRHLWHFRTIHWRNIDLWVEHPTIVPSEEFNLDVTPLSYQEYY